jgi:ABC-type sugar transport system ATPase subunit
VQNLSRAGVFQDISFSVHAGEIVGMAGLVGAGRTEVAQTIFGIERANSGTISINGQVIAPGLVQAAMQHGVALVPEDRQHLGLVLPMPVGTNLVLAVLRRLSSRGLRSSRAESELIAQLMRDLGVRAASPGVAARTLSGGNQQKLVLGKWLATKPRLLILDEPTRGVDVGAKAEVYRLIRGLADEGLATLLISSDLPEVLALSDRIVVMREGRISGELSREQATAQKVLELALPIDNAEGAQEAA